MNPIDDYALITNATSRRASSWDRAGGNIDAIPDIEPGQTVTLLDTAGPGKITHLWMTMTEYDHSGHDTVLRDMVVRMYWDGATVPSVEVPLGDFFGLGHALPPSTFYYPRNFAINSMPVTVGGSERAFNCYWPMPFHKSARIEVCNNGLRTLRLFYFHVDYELAPQPANSGLFHAAFGQERALKGQIPGTEEEYSNLDGRDNLVLLETVGCGHYAGCFFFVDCSGDAWWGEGDDMIYIDHDPMPTINGTGSEDYFNNAWGYNRAFCHPYYGAPLVEKRPDGGSYMTLYRFHIPDPIRFKKHLKVTIEKWWSQQKSNAISFVVFWYQQTPVTTRSALPRGVENHPAGRVVDPTWHISGQEIDLSVPALEVPLRARGVDVHVIEFIDRDCLHSKGGLLLITHGQKLGIPLVIPEDGWYRVEVKPLYKRIVGMLALGLEGLPAVSIAQQTPDREADGAYVNLGETQARERKIMLWVMADTIAPLHRIRLTRLHRAAD